MARPGQLPRISAQHLLDGADPGGQTETLE
jgi:hypothetical protein